MNYLEKYLANKKKFVGTSLVVQWLRLHTSSVGWPEFDPWSVNQIPYATAQSSRAATKDPECHN